MMLFQKKNKQKKIQSSNKLPFHFSEFQAKLRKHIKPLTAAATSLFPKHSLKELWRALQESTSQAVDTFNLGNPIP